MLNLNSVGYDSMRQKSPVLIRRGDRQQPKARSDGLYVERRGDILHIHIVCLGGPNQTNGTEKEAEILPLYYY